MDVQSLRGIAVRASFSQDELDLLDNSKVADQSDASYVNTLTLIYTSRMLKDSVDGLMRATEDLAQSGTRYSRRLIWFTVALVLIAAVQIVLSFLAVP